MACELLATSLPGECPYTKYKTCLDERTKDCTDLTECWYDYFMNAAVIKL